MKIKLGGLLLDQAATLLQPPAMNLELRKMRWNGGECCGLALLSHGCLYRLVGNQKQTDNWRKISSMGLY